MYGVRSDTRGYIVVSMEYYSQTSLEKGEKTVKVEEETVKESDIKPSIFRGWSKLYLQPILRSLECNPS
jgi:hypothetical protein